MPKAADIAIELRKLADRLDSNPEAELVAPTIYFTHAYLAASFNAKNLFLALAKLLPRPLKKGDGFLTMR